MRTIPPAKPGQPLEIKPSLVTVILYHEKTGFIFESYSADDFPNQFDLEDAKVRLFCREMSVPPQSVSAVAKRISDGDIASAAFSQLLADLPEFGESEFSIMMSPLSADLVAGMDHGPLMAILDELTRAAGSGTMTEVAESNLALVQGEVRRRMEEGLRVDKGVVAKPSGGIGRRRDE
jgi:hypothetical protein